MASLLDELLAKVSAGDPASREARAIAIKHTAAMPWVPNTGPQTEAYFCEADEVFYGGEAGGGKSDLLVGLGLTAHRSSLILRRFNKDAKKLAKRCRNVAGRGSRYNGQDMIVTAADGREIEFGGLKLEDDKERHKGRDHDLKGWDEICDFTESQYVFVNGWNRSAVDGQRSRIVATGNPPTRPEGFWVLKRWGAWLDGNHPNPAKPGELRWYAVDDLGNDVEVDGPGPHELADCRQPVLARSRTFIRSRVTDNPDLIRQGYQATLDQLPAHLRSAYRDGNFSATINDDDWQVIPTAWIEAAQQRWENKIPPRTPMTAMAVDVAPGGGDKRAICWRYGGWFAPIQAEKVVDKTGRLTASEVVKHRRDRCPVIVDLGGGWGGDALIAMKDNGIDCYAFNGVVTVTSRTRDGKQKFRNKRAEATWRFREALDPSQEGGSAVALPPDPELKADLAAYRYEDTVGGILIEDKEKMKDRLGRSPDKGDAAIMCLSEGQKISERLARAGRSGGAMVANTGGRTFASVRK